MPFVDRNLKQHHYGQMRYHERNGEDTAARHTIKATGINADALEAFKRVYALGCYRLGKIPTKAETDYLSGRM